MLRVLRDVVSEIDPLSWYTYDPLDTYTDASRDPDDDDRPPVIETDATDADPTLTESPPRRVNVDDDSDDVPTPEPTHTDPPPTPATPPSCTVEVEEGDDEDELSPPTIDILPQD